MDLSMRPKADGRMQPMTAKKKLLEPVVTLSEAETGEALRPLDARQDEAEGRVGQPVEGARGRIRRFDAAPCGVRARRRQRAVVRRGEVFWAELSVVTAGPCRPRTHPERGRRPAVVMTRDEAIDFFNEVLVVLATTTIRALAPLVATSEISSSAAQAATKDIRPRIDRKTSKSEGQMERRPR